MSHIARNGFWSGVYELRVLLSAVAAEVNTSVSIGDKGIWRPAQVALEAEPDFDRVGLLDSAAGEVLVY